MSNNILSFANKYYILPETGKSIKLEPHQRKILKYCFTENRKGLFPYQTIIYACPKKSGKTEVGGLVGLWFAVTQGRYNEIYYIANDLEQSQSRGFRRVTQVVENNLQGYPNFNVTRYAVQIARTGTRIQALSFDYAGEAGANPGLTVWDELWGYISTASRRLWTELSPVPTRENSIRFITTYAGFEGESELLWDLYQLGMAGRQLDWDIPVWVNDEAGLFMYWDHEHRMSWQKGIQAEKYYDRERKILRPNEFRRLHENRWVSAVTRYIPIEAWDGCCISDMRPIMPGFSEPLFIGVDIGIKRDTTAAVAVYWDKENKKVKLASHRVWHPTPSEPLDFEATIERYLLDLNQYFKVASVYYDPSQFVRSMQLLQGSGIPLTEYTQVPSNLTSMTQILFELIRGRNLLMYPDTELRQQSLSCDIIEGARGMRIAKEKASEKIDAIVALAMACQAAWDGIGITPLPESQPEAFTSRWNMGEVTMPVMVDSEESKSKSRWRI